MLSNPNPISKSLRKIIEEKDFSEGKKKALLEMVDKIQKQEEIILTPKGIISFDTVIAGIVIMQCMMRISNIVTKESCENNLKANNKIITGINHIPNKTSIVNFPY